MSIKSIIADLDAHRVEARKGMHENHKSFVALHKAYPKLRLAALAGDALARMVAEMNEVDWNDRTPRDKFEARKYVNELWRSKRNAALTAYARAIKGL